jgi:hypothetical protein
MGAVHRKTDELKGAPIDAAGVGLVGDVVLLHPTNRNVDPISMTIAVDETRIDGSFRVNL